MLACAALAWAPQGFAFDIAELMAMLAGVAESRVAFEEKRYVAALTEPIVRTGTLLYIRPDRLEMRVERPQPERMEIRGDTVTLEAHNGTRRTSLSSQPILAAWIDSLRATLAGDFASLDRHFRVRLSGGVESWRLELVPREGELAEVVKHIDVSGKNVQISRFEIEDALGNRTVLDVKPIKGEAR
jgi:outer membrane lipoprotein-sorting protein